MKGTTETSRIFLYSIWSGFTHIPTSGILAHGNRKASRGSMGSLNVLYLCMMQGFPYLGDGPHNSQTLAHSLHLKESPPPPTKYLLPPLNNSFQVMTLKKTTFLAVSLLLFHFSFHFILFGHLGHVNFDFN